MILSKKIFTLLGSALLICFTTLSYADWFTSPEIKESIIKADAGDKAAQFRVGSAYDTGDGAPRSRDKAMKYYLMAAEQGHADAQNSLGSGLQAEKNYSEALTWYERASAQNHALATNNLAYLYDLGLGTKQDRQKAFELYSIAANLGWAESMWNIANMYGAGQLGKIDMVMACTWVVRADRYASSWNGEVIRTHAERVMSQLQNKLAKHEFSKCQEEGNSWTPTSFANGKK
jgi:uncharacterized protein